MMEKTPEETYKVLRNACEKAAGAPYVHFDPRAVLEAFDYLQQSSSKAPKKIES